MGNALPLLLVFSPMLYIGLLVLTSGAAPAAPAEPAKSSGGGAKSLYEKIGGEAAINAAVDIFYRKVLKDERINKFFQGVDMTKQAAKQKAFLTMALGGPNKYTGEDMRKGHAHLVAKGLNNSHFDAVMENLGATLTELKVPGELIAQAAAIAESTRKDVLAGEPSLYEKIGGEAAMNAAVDLFYRKVLKDERINKFFEGTDMVKQAAKQKAFLTMALGGPNNYTGEDMRKGHAHLVAKGLNNSHFDAVMENLGATLTELKVPGELIAQAAAIAESTRKDVLAGEPSLYEKIGGEAAMNAAVDLFYRKVLKDERINKFFEGTDMVKQAAKQKAFLTMALGGPNNYTGEDMRKGHAHLVAKGLNNSHFDAVMENLGATLTELKVPGELIAQAAAIAESTRKDVLAGEPSLYEKIGGEAAMNAAVDLFYRKVLKDERINKFFEGTDMVKQAAKQKAFLTMALGGPNNYTGEDMRKGHAHLVAKGLNNSHFDAVMENLGATLTELKVPGELIAQAAAIAESTRKDVLAGEPSLYEKIGGEAAMNAAVDLFYRKVLKDERINKFFEGTDMVKQAAKQKAFLTMALGGPNNYTGEDMRKGHAHLVAKGLNDSHFDAVMENLGATLTELKVSGELIAQAAAIAESTRKDVLGK